MKITDKRIQKEFFAREIHQYKPAFINNPPLHTKLELDIFLKKLDVLPRGAVIADFGAGTGRIAIPLLQKGYTVWAIDISKESLQKLQKLASLIPHAKLHITNQIPKKILFDAIVGADILHHVSFSEYFPVIFRSLKKGGRTIFSEPGALNPAWYVYLSLFNWQAEKGFMNCSYMNLYNSFQKYGFRKTVVEGLGLIPRPFFNFSEKLCSANDSFGNLPGIKYFAYRFIIESIK